MSHPCAWIVLIMRGCILQVPGLSSAAVGSSGTASPTPLLRPHHRAPQASTALSLHSKHQKPLFDQELGSSNSANKGSALVQSPAAPVGSVVDGQSSSSLPGRSSAGGAYNSPSPPQSGRSQELHPTQKCCIDVEGNIHSSLRHAPELVVEQATAIAAALHALLSVRPTSPPDRQACPGTAPSRCTSGRDSPHRKGTVSFGGSVQHPMLLQAAIFVRDQKQLIRRRQMAMQKAREEWQKSADVLEWVEPSVQRDNLADMLRQVRVAPCAPWIRPCTQ
jgi:hypothetical protein